VSSLLDWIPSITYRSWRRLRLPIDDGIVPASELSLMTLEQRQSSVVSRRHPNDGEQLSYRLVMLARLPIESGM